ncbi:MAG: PAS domain S-box protein [Dehalococcoidales bacterium]|nr:PAS domain S-box protein [Dehalococcoidales bacterium]
MNTKLRGIQKEPRSSYDRYQHLFEFAPAGYFVLNKDDLILEVNRTGSEFLGYSQSYLLRKRFTRFILPQSLDTYYDHKKRAFETGQRQSDEIEISSKSGRPLCARIDSIVLPEQDRDDLSLRIAVTDITKQAFERTSHKQYRDTLAKARDDLETRVVERTAQLTDANASLKLEFNVRKQMENEMARNLTFTAKLLENVPNPIMVHEADWTVSYVNKALETLTGFTAGELIGTRPPFPWWPPDKTAAYKRKLNTPSKRTVKQSERLFRKKNGEPLWITLTATPISDSKGEIVSRLSIWQDITSQKAAQKKLQEYQDDLRSLASRLVLTEQNERHNIAILIHDGVTQILSLCAVKMKILLDSVSDADIITPLREIYNLLQQAIEDTLTLTFELSPPSLYDLGLEAALEELVERFGQKRGIKTYYDDDGKQKSLEESTSILLFQTVRDILYGVSRYDEAKSVKVSVNRVDDRIQIKVKDDGRSLLLNGRGNSKQTPFDLFSIRERFRNAGGQIRVNTIPGKGTRFTLIAPLKGKLE